MRKDFNKKFKKKSKKENQNKNNDKNMLHVSSSKQSQDYENASQQLINNTKKEHIRGNDMHQALRNLELLDMSKWEPTLTVLSKNDPPKKAREDKLNDLKYKM